MRSALPPKGVSERPTGAPLLRDAGGLREATKGWRCYEGLG